MKTQKWWIIVVVILVLAIAGVLFFLSNSKQPIEEYSIDTIFIKTQLTEKGNAISDINLKSNVAGDYSIKITGMDNLASIDESMFSLNSEENKKISIYFNAQDYLPGIYLGELEINSKNQIKKIPIIVEIQSETVLFDSNLNLFPKTGIIPGSSLSAEIKIFDLANVGISNLKLNYFIKDFNENIIDFGEEEIVINGNLPLTKSFNLPYTLKQEDYVFGVIVKYDGSVGTSSVLFNVATEKPEGFQIGLVHIALFIAFLFVIFLILFVYFIFCRDRALTEMQNQYKRETNRQRELILQQEKKVCSRLNTNKEKNEYKKELEKIKKQRLSALRQIHEKRIIEIKKIKKTKNKDALKSQLDKWRKQGYDTQILEKRYKLPGPKDIKKKIEEWKEQGYDTKVLDKHLNK
ncbi:MAG: hypothetical protein WC438_05375 [Candidatus Pacearchaeota archaeon]